MTYVRGAATASQSARAMSERERQEVERLYAEGRALAQTARQLRIKNANLEAKVAEEQDRLEDKRATLTQALKDLEAAQAEADAAILEAEKNAALICELAYDQARALCERAYVKGKRRGDDAARAKHAVLKKLTPAPKKPGKVVDLTPQPPLGPAPDGPDGLEAARDEFFNYQRSRGVRAPGRQYAA